MTTAQVGYAPVPRWVKNVLGSTPPTVVITVAWAVLCLRVAQRVTAATLARAFPAEQGGAGRSCLRRVRRWWQGPELEQATISPALIRLALTLWTTAQPVVAMDTTRLGPWEVWLAGLVVAGRPLPIGWAVIPSPWPKGRFRATTLALIQQLQQALPAGVRWTLVADRGFPRARLFAPWRQGNTDCSMRLRVSAWGTVAGVYAMVAVHLAAGRLMDGQRTAAAMGRGRSDQPLVPGWIVVSTAGATPSKHKQNPGPAGGGQGRGRPGHDGARRGRWGSRDAPSLAGADPDRGPWGALAPGSAAGERRQRARSALGATPRTWWSVMHSVSTPRGRQCPQPQKTAGTCRPLERGLHGPMRSLRASASNTMVASGLWTMAGYRVRSIFSISTYSEVTGDQTSAVCVAPKNA